MITLKRSTLIRSASPRSRSRTVPQRLRQPASASSQGSLDYLDRNSYVQNMRVLGVFQLGEERGHKLQMMAIGARRFILQTAT